MARRKRVPVRDEHDPGELLTTGELMKRSGLSRQVLYQYTTMGLIREAAQTRAGYRLYPVETLRRLEIIRSLNEMGYTLRDIKEIFAERLLPT
ncbi:MAG: MerR family transcriptional regulator [Planctomycetota bacterium]|nr:MAG: MerR family transcriptional regulator [Planctomycetota bacterium]